MKMTVYGLNVLLYVLQANVKLTVYGLNVLLYVLQANVKLTVLRVLAISIWILTFAWCVGKHVNDIAKYR